MISQASIARMPFRRTTTLLLLLVVRALSGSPSRLSTTTIELNAQNKQRTRETNLDAMSKIVIASVARTPIGKFQGSLSSLKGTELGSISIKAALSRLPSDFGFVREAIVGNVVSAGMGQAPARQAVLGAGLPESTVCTTVNKVCASGMKSVMLAAQSLQSNGGDTGAMMIAGGFESMSNIPHYLENSRKGTSLGNSRLIDGVITDGLWDVYNDQV